jgi:hypothetical protein
LVSGNAAEPGAPAAPILSIMDRSLLRSSWMKLAPARPSHRASMRHSFAGARSRPRCPIDDAAIGARPWRVADSTSLGTDGQRRFELRLLGLFQRPDA